MEKKLKILFLEDSKSDFELIKHQLKKENISFDSKRVETEEDFTKELKDFSPDLILSRAVFCASSTMEYIFFSFRFAFPNTTVRVISDAYPSLTVPISKRIISPGLSFLFEETA